MLSSREIQAFLLAPAAAPAVAAVAFGSPSQLVVTVVVSYVAAFAFGAPLYLLLSRRVASLIWSCVGAGVVAGAASGGLLTAALLWGMSPARFMANPGGVAFFTSFGILVGAGLGLVAGLMLFALLRARLPRVDGVNGV